MKLSMYTFLDSSRSDMKLESCIKSMINYKEFNTLENPAVPTCEDEPQSSSKKSAYSLVCTPPALLSHV